VKLEHVSLFIKRLKMRTMMKKRSSSKRMENPHKDQLKIKSSKLYQITSKKKKLRNRWISGQCTTVFVKKTEQIMLTGRETIFKTVNLKMYYFVNLYGN